MSPLIKRILDELIELRRKLEYIYTALGLDMEVLKTDPASVLRNLRTLELAFNHVDEISTQEILWCCRLFLSLTPEYCRSLHEVSGRPDYHKELLGLANDLQGRADQESTELSRLCMAGRRNLQHALYCYLRGIVNDWAEVEVPDDRVTHASIRQLVKRTK